MEVGTGVAVRSVWSTTAGTALSISRHELLRELALVSGGMVYVAHRRDAALRSWHLMVGGVFYLAFLVAFVFAVV
jgi:hypothetical protein